MLRRLVPVVVVFSFTLAGAAALWAAQPQTGKPGVVVHEWGTFTTVADQAGQAMNWTPLGGPTDLPCFVEHYKNKLYKTGIGPEWEGPIEYDAARLSLVGKVRMETPVLYFYSPAEATVSVNVRFPQGLITEWYPTAVTNQPNVVPGLLDNPNLVGGVSWPVVHITPGRAAALPTEAAKSHYYAARLTDSVPVTAGGKDEKFLFYRGVASFPVPLSAALEADGSIVVKNLDPEPLPAVIRFDNRAGRLSYSLRTSLKSTTRMDRPAAPASLDALHADLVRLLIATGLYKKEAEAMVATWRDSWFEEGTRVFYIVPSKTVDAVLPLSVAPAPASVARAFVGRMEVITPEDVLRVQAAMAANDTAALEKHGRFLGPIADRLAANLTSVSDRSRVRAIASDVFARYVARFGSCR